MRLAQWRLKAKFEVSAFAYRVAKLKLFASISATDAKPKTVSRNIKNYYPI